MTEKIQVGGRRSGRTAKMMQSAPHGCVIVWCNDVLHYPTALARHLGREDLKIVSPRWIEHGQWRGITFPALRADHAVSFTERLWEAYLHAETAVRQPQPGGASE